MPSHPATRRALWSLAFRQRSVWLRAVKLGLTVGLLQAVINQGDHWLAHAVDGRVLAKSIISPLIGFTLVLFSAAATWVERTTERLTDGTPHFTAPPRLCPGSKLRPPNETTHSPRRRRPRAAPAAADRFHAPY